MGDDDYGRVIGRGGRHIPPEAALDHVAGITLLNDGSVRGWQKHSLHAGKNFAHSGGCGPWIVTADELDGSAWADVLGAMTARDPGDRPSAAEVAVRRLRRER